MYYLVNKRGSLPELQLCRYCRWRQGELDPRTAGIPRHNGPKWLLARHKNPVAEGKHESGDQRYQEEKDPARTVLWLLHTRCVYELGV